VTLLAAGLAIALAAPMQAPPAPAETLLVARHDLARGVALTAADIDTVVTDERRASGVERRAEWPAPGWITRRVMRAGEPLRAPAVAPPPLVAGGARVTLVWEVDGLRLTREGTALGAARRGERVLVRVDATRRFAGIATAPGVVTVADP
jgi:flagella basal body P-ring formation protein FlgA